jgi:hypothetical protein
MRAHTKNFARLKKNGKLSEKTEVKRWVKQENFLSPLMFDVAMNEIIEDVRQKGMQNS